MRAVIYARYSSDLQRDASIEDQVRVCRRRIDAEGWSLQRVYSDHGASGASHLRAGYQALLQDARKQQFDVVVAESLDRLSRDQEHVAGLYKQLSFHGVLLRHDRRRRDLRAARRPEGRHERPLPQGPGAEDAARTGGPGAARSVRRRPVVRLSDRAGDRAGRRADDGRARGRPERSRSRPQHLRRLRGRQEPEGDREGPERPGRRRAARRALGRVDDLRQLAARHRHPEQRALCRPARLEPPAVRQGPRDEPASGSAEP